MQAEVGSLTAEHNADQASLYDSQEKVSQLQVDASNAQSELSALQREHTKLQQDHANLQREQADLECERDTLQRLFDALKPPQKSPGDVLSCPPCLTLSFLCDAQPCQSLPHHYLLVEAGQLASRMACKFFGRNGIDMPIINIYE